MIWRVTSGVHVALPECGCHLLEMAVVLIVAASLTGKQDMERMVEIIVPLCVEAISSQFLAPQNAGVIGRALGDQEDSTVETVSPRMDSLCQFRQKRNR